MLLQFTVAEGLYVCHTRDPLSIIHYVAQDIEVFLTIQWSDVSSFLNAKFHFLKFRGSPQMSVLKRGIPPIKSKYLTNNLPVDQ